MSFIDKGERPSLYKDFLKSKRTERQWNRNRLTMTWAVRRQHHSPEGRRIHRQLGMYLALRRPETYKGLFDLDSWGRRAASSQRSTR